MTPPRIAYLITRSEPGGAQSHLLSLLRHFHSRYQVVLGSGEEEALCDAARDLGIEVTVFSQLGREIAPLRDLRALGQIRAWLRSQAPDLVHAHSSKAGLLGRAAAWWEGIPSVFTAHGWAFTEGVPFRRRALSLPLERLAARVTRRVVTVSETDRQAALSQGVGRPEQLRTIPNGIPGEAPQADPGAPGDCHVISVARFSEPKDQALLLRALAGVEGDFRVTLVGTGPLLAGVRKLADELGLAPRCHFPGACGDVPERLAGASLFVLPSRWEGYPLTVLEAMRAGLPVIASDVGGTRETLEDGVSGFLVPRGDEEALRGRLRELVGDPELRRRMGQRAREHFLAHHLEEPMLRALGEVYQQVLGSGSGAILEPHATR